MPPTLASRPLPDESTFLYLEVFNELSSSRGGGSSPNPIPFSEVMQYCTELGIFDTDERFTYWRIIHACDMKMLADHVAAEEKRLEELKNQNKG